MDLMIQISVVIVAVAFAAFMYAIIRTLRVLKDTLVEIRQTVGHLGTDISQISSEMKEMIHHTNAVTQDVRLKLSALDILFTTVNDIGQTAHIFTGAMKETAAGLVASLKQGAREQEEVPAEANRGKLVGAIVDGIQSTLRIWRKIKNV